MRINVRLKKANPFRKFFASATIISCLVLSIIFFFISYWSNKNVQERYNQEKADALMEDFEEQLQTMEDIAIRCASNRKFHPNYFNGYLSREFQLLEEFAQFRYFSALTDEYFLYYGGDRIYCPNEKTLDLNIYVQSKSEEPEEQKKFLAELTKMREEHTTYVVQSNTAPVLDHIYVFHSFSVSEGSEWTKAVLFFVVKDKDLEERFQMISGGIGGNITLYRESELLYCNQSKVSTPEMRRVLTVTSSDGIYTLCYLPDKVSVMQSGLLLMQFLLILADLILVWATSHVFAEKAYRPIEGISEKYREKLLFKESEHEDALAEIDYMMAGMQMRMKQKQEILRNQILRMLLEGNASAEVLSNSEEMQIRLPGPFFYVMSISFGEEPDVTEAFLDHLQKEIELISARNEQEYIYSIGSFGEKVIHVICSIPVEGRKKELSEMVCEVAESFAYEPIVGIGKVYQNISLVSASWLESMDDLQNMKKQQSNKKQQRFVYDLREMHSIFTALEKGDEKEATNMLERYVARLDEEPMSLLMLQYISTNFMGEISKLSKKYMLELSRQNISLFVVAKNTEGFKAAAMNMIREFCEKLAAIKSEQKEDELYGVYEYINMHFEEYNMSIEKAAEDMQVSVAVVRQAVLKYTGKTYKDYLIYLRIEYAKILLRQENMTVSEVCQRVGYGNIPYFITLFKNVVGMTPAKYKKDSRD